MTKQTQKPKEKKKSQPKKKAKKSSTLILKNEPEITSQLHPFREFLSKNPIGKKGGRPSTVTPLTVAKLEEAFALDMTVKEACIYADISRDAYYRFVKENEDFRNRFDELKELPVMFMRKVVINDAMSNPEMAFKYLGVKKKGEFATRIENINTNNNTDIHMVDERTASLIKSSLGGFGKKLAELSAKNKAKADKKK